jgi:hypothetical protein
LKILYKSISQHPGHRSVGGSVGDIVGGNSSDNGSGNGSNNDSGNKNLIDEVSSINLTTYLTRKNKVFMVCMIK